jgi:hypothetical protein
MLRLEDLYKSQTEQKTHNQLVYEHILKQCHRRIQLVNRKLKIYECWFRVPTYVFGFPAFDVADVTKYLCQKLEKNGLTVHYIEDGLIYIIWDPSQIDFERYQKTLNRTETRLQIVKDDNVDVPEMFPPISSDSPTRKKRNAKTKEAEESADEANVAVIKYDPILDDLIPINTKKIQRTKKPKAHPWKLSLCDNLG